MDVKKKPDNFERKDCWLIEANRVHSAHTWTYKRLGGQFWCPGHNSKNVIKE